jgi:predicted metal-binding membrane protein
MSEGPAHSIAMWVAMMFVMMLPPALLLARAYRAALRRDREGEWLRAGAVMAGHLGIWLGFAVIAGFVQAAFGGFGLLGGDRLASPSAGGALVFAAGIYQFTPWKNAFVEHCRAPLGFLASHWRSGTAGALRMGAVFGVHCMGCCWLLFAALFALGTASMAWMAVLFAIVFGERWGRFSRWVTRAAGAGALVYGAALLIA